MKGKEVILIIKLIALCQKLPLNLLIGKKSFSAGLRNNLSTCVEKVAAKEMLKKRLSHHGQNSAPVNTVGQAED